MNLRVAGSKSGAFALGGVLQDYATVIDVAATASGFGIGHWERRGGGRIAYRRPDHHTFSLYLQGGRQVRPIEGDRPGRVAGGPGAICVMPAGSDTEWDNRGYVRWTHIYFHSHHLAHATDGRVADARAATFICDPVARDLMQRFVLALDWSDDTDVMALEHALYALLARLALRDDAPSPFRRGGLTSVQMRRVQSLVEDRLGERVAIADLAEATGLSVRQFSRAFVQTEDMPPYEWVLRKRLERARAMLANGEPGAQVAAACGFSSQSHMARRMRERFG